MKTWTERKERGSELLIHLIVWLARKAGRPLCRALLYPIVLYFMITDAPARNASAEFLSTVLGRPSRWFEVFAHLYSFATTLLDRVYMAAGQFDRFEVTIEGLSLFDEALAQGRGCVLLGSHLGSFDLMMLAHRVMDKRPVSAMMRIDPHARLRRIAGIDDNAFDIIPLGQPDCFLRAMEALNQGRAVVILADRVDGSARRRATFLGRTVWLPIAPHVLAARAQAPVLMCFGLYEGDNRYRIEFADFGPAAQRTARDEALQTVIDRYAQRLEHYARRYPLNWFNFYPYWATPSDAS
ncbi:MULTISPECIES: acyl-CoA synthetase [Caldimonas]|uniref:LpxL/LpxP family acyltransferase n=1 Tax=Caldimonas TaxID=196013 RepID=UPI0018DC9803|nr:acyl-CoA synthetase [Caldimonas taiwanensis]MCX7659786.1 acyl-CoA synthetase [Caldimonas manganoxidans]